MKTLRNLDLYVMLTPGILFFLIFSYFPMVWIFIAFQDFKIGQGLAGSAFVGFKHFAALFQDEYFYVILRNTVLISSLKLLFGFPVPIVLALAMNEIRQRFVLRTIQSVIYLPHFLSWAVVATLMISIFSFDNGILNDFLKMLGFEPIAFLSDASSFRTMLVLSDIWKGAGWGTILYLAALTGIDQHLYEAARIDGASKLRQMWHISLPGIQTTMTLLLILSMGSLVTGDFEQILLMYSPAVYNVADVIQTYVYRIGLGQLRLSYTTAVGLFQSVVSFLLVYLANRTARKLGGDSIW
ncbi:sugar ABC transporter permease [Paenibacillus antri]|uniref:Sugar ABC transporter permease n=1 Tax=Paenibacillus antri TaxID=2582848 RepID=A0A5R9GFS8_9BACL|nr:ABC transporter permease subunit [Paenibacillus antri]TLS52124.1 sugar ABC transporter permease [Paenibacillus antri]